MTETPDLLAALQASISKARADWKDPTPAPRLELEPGDTGQAILPAQTVKDQGASTPDGRAGRLLQMRALTDAQRRIALAYIIGRTPSVFDEALVEARGLS